jgi:hypothetical protein
MKISESKLTLYSPVQFFNEMNIIRCRGFDGLTIEVCKKFWNEIKQIHRKLI